MDTNHWFTQILLWPHLGVVISTIGLLLLIFLISKETPSGKADTQVSAPVATVTISTPDRLVKNNTPKEADKWLTLFREREQLEEEELQLKAVMPGSASNQLLNRHG